MVSMYVGAWRYVRMYAHTYVHTLGVWRDVCTYIHTFSQPEDSPLGIVQPRATNCMEQIVQPAAWYRKLHKFTIKHTPNSDQIWIYPVFTHKVHIILCVHTYICVHMHTYVHIHDVRWCGVILFRLAGLPREVDLFWTQPKQHYSHDDHMTNTWCSHNGSDIITNYLFSLSFVIVYYLWCRCLS